MMLSAHESEDEVIVIKEIDETSLELLLAYIYTGSIEIQDITIGTNLLHAAALLQLPKVTDFCFEFMANNINSENCFRFWMLARKYGSGAQIGRICMFLVHNVASVKTKEEFLSLSEDVLVEYLGKLRDLSKNSAEVESALFRWIKFDPVHRLASFQKLSQITDNPGPVKDKVRSLYMGS